VNSRSVRPRPVEAGSRRGQTALQQQLQLAFARQANLATQTVPAAYAIGVELQFAQDSASRCQIGTGQMQLARHHPLIAVTELRDEIESANLPDAGKRQARRLQIRAQFGRAGTATENELTIDVARYPEWIELRCANRHGQPIADGAKGTLGRQAIVARNQCDVGLAQALPGKIDFTAAGQGFRTQVAVAQAKTQAQSKLRPAAPLRVEVGIEARRRQLRKTTGVEILQRSPQGELPAPRLRHLATGDQLRVAGDQAQLLDEHRGRVDRQPALDRELRVAQLGFQYLPVQPDRGAQRAGKQRAAQAAMQRTRVERPHRQMQRQFGIAQDTAALQASAAQQTHIEISQAQLVVAQTQAGPQRFERQAVSVEGPGTPIEHRQPPTQAGRRTTPRLQLDLHIEDGLRSAFDPGRRVDRRKCDQRLPDRL
jgi:hypothetical protein